MLSMMNSTSTADAVEFYAASPSSTRQNADIAGAFNQIKKRPNITYTSDGRRYVDGRLIAGQVNLEPHKTWNMVIINEIAKKQIQTAEPEIQRKNSTQKVITSLRKFLPFVNKSGSKQRKQDALIPKTKFVCPKK